MLPEQPMEGFWLMRFASRGIIFFLVLALASLSNAEVCARTINVPADYSTISEALSKASDGDIVRIAPGRYFESELRMGHTVTLIGAGESPEEVIIDGNNQARILWCESIGNDATIQNISFQNGNSTGEAIYDQSGGAILFSNCSPRVIDCIFIGNEAAASGGAIRCTNASPDIINCSFTNNNAGDGGGAIDCSYASSPQILNCFFKKNTARWGGGLSCRGDASPHVIKCNFDRNSSAETDLGYGGAVFADYEANPVFTECTFYGNEARYGGAVACFQNSQTNLDQCTVLNNSAAWMGGGMFCNDASPSISRSIFAFQNGTAITAAGAAVPKITFTDIFGNSRGDWIGSIADQEGYTNFSLDPVFCSYDPDFRFSFTLCDDSPLGPAFVEEGQIGAWPIGCAPASAALQFSAAWDNGHPMIQWITDPDANPITFRLTRTSSTQDRSVTEIPYMSEEDNEFNALDGSITPAEGQEYIYCLYMLDSEEEWILLAQTSLDSGLPDHPTLEIQAFPNPFNPSTNIHFTVDRTQRIQVSIFDIRGNRITLLVDSVMDPGAQIIPWHGCDDFGMKVGSGTYFVVVQGNSVTQSEKIMMIK